MIYQLLFGSGRMVTYTVHEPPHPPVDRVDRAEGLRFVKDGFIFPAFLLGVFWLIAHRLWLGTALYVLAGLGILLANAFLGLDDTMALAALIGLNLMVGFEADQAERASLERKGWQSLGAVTGTSALDCERRFFETWLPVQPMLSPRTPSPASVPASGRAAGRLAALWRRPG